MDNEGNSFDKSHEVASEKKQLIHGDSVNRVHPGPEK